MPEPTERPFDALGELLQPGAPDPAFTSRLRDRIARAFDLPRGVTVSDLHLDDPYGDHLDRDDPPLDRAGARPGAVITPYLAVAGAAEALRWYRDAFGAEPRGEPIVMSDGRIGHAELDIGGALLMLAEQHPEIGVEAPAPGSGASVTLHLSVDSADAVDGVMARAVAAGARLERPAADYDHGRNGVVRDPFGHRWLVAAEPAPAFRHGDIGYVSLWVPDQERAARFFATVLGWSYRPARQGGGRQVEGQTLHHGLWAADGHSTLFCCYAVDDVAAAVIRVREAGGRADEPRPEPYGLVAGCTDDQGTRFAVFQPPGGTRRDAAPPLHGLRHGDVAYVTMEVTDSARARAFYGAVLDWRFTPGRVDDGWQVEDVAPMVGLAGGRAPATTVPMYRVDDAAAAVAAVRAAGGTATDPEAQPYGLSSTCTDDQGTRFFLGQL